MDSTRGIVDTWKQRTDHLEVSMEWKYKPISKALFVQKWPAGRIVWYHILLCSCRFPANLIVPRLYCVVLSG